VEALALCSEESRQVTAVREPSETSLIDVIALAKINGSELTSGIFL